MKVGVRQKDCRGYQLCGI